MPTKLKQCFCLIHGIKLEWQENKNHMSQTSLIGRMSSKLKRKLYDSETKFKLLQNGALCFAPDESTDRYSTQRVWLQLSERKH